MKKALFCSCLSSLHTKPHLEPQIYCFFMFWKSRNVNFLLSNVQDGCTYPLSLNIRSSLFYLHKHCNFEVICISAHIWNTKESRRYQKLICHLWQNLQKAMHSLINVICMYILPLIFTRRWLVIAPWLLYLWQFKLTL